MLARNAVKNEYRMLVYAWPVRPFPCYREAVVSSRYIDKQEARTKKPRAHNHALLSTTILAHGQKDCCCAAHATRSTSVGQRHAGLVLPSLCRIEAVAEHQLIRHAAARQAIPPEHNPAPLSSMLQDFTLLLGSECKSRLHIYALPPNI
jgi:hypothetical protein